MTLKKDLELYDWVYVLMVTKLGALDYNVQLCSRCGLYYTFFVDAIFFETLVQLAKNQKTIL